MCYGAGLRRGLATERQAPEIHGKRAKMQRTNPWYGTDDENAKTSHSTTIVGGDNSGLGLRLVSRFGDWT